VEGINRAWENCIEKHPRSEIGVFIPGFSGVNILIWEAVPNEWELGAQAFTHGKGMYILIPVIQSRCD
jgi:hypothetical protein